MTENDSPDEQALAAAIRGDLRTRSWGVTDDVVFEAVRAVLDDVRNEAHNGDNDAEAAIQRYTTHLTRILRGSIEPPDPKVGDRVMWTRVLFQSTAIWVHGEVLGNESDRATIRVDWNSAREPGEVVSVRHDALIREPRPRSTR